MCKYSYLFEDDRGLFNVLINGIPNVNGNVLSNIVQTFVVNDEQKLQIVFLKFDSYLTGDKFSKIKRIGCQKIFKKLNECFKKEKPDNLDIELQLFNRRGDIKEITKFNECTCSKILYEDEDRLIVEFDYKNSKNTILNGTTDK